MRPGLRAALSLEYPMSLGVHDTYEEAQKAVDYLSDHEFPVQDVLIVGTDLRHSSSGSPAGSPRAGSSAPGRCRACGSVCSSA